MRKSRISLVGASCALMLLGSAMARADRIVLAPEGGTLAPDGFKLEFAISPYLHEENRSWIQLSTPQSIELEANRVDLFGDRRDRYSLNVQYPVISDLGTTPSISLGVRDLLGSGTEHRSFYLVVGKTLALSRRQRRLVTDLRISAGVGTERFNGLFFGVQARFKAGFSLSAEIFRNRPNVSLGLPLVRNLQAKAYSLDGDVFYGLTYTLAR